MSFVQVLERDGWTGLEEVTRLLNGHEFAVTGLISRRINMPFEEAGVTVYKSKVNPHLNVSGH